MEISRYWKPESQKFSIPRKKDQKLVLESLRQGIFTQPVQQKEQRVTVPWKNFPDFLQHDLKCDHFFIETTENDLSGVCEIFSRTENNP